jgi:hypothetical protein
LKDEIEKKTRKTQVNTWVTRKTRDPSHKTVITHPIKRKSKNNYEAQFSINSILKDEVEEK